MEILEIVNMYNNENLSLQEISERVGGSRSSIQRRLSKEGWSFDKSLKKYVKNDTNKTSEMESNIAMGQHDNETTNKDNNITTNTVNSETVSIVNRTYGIPSHVDMALKLKATFEGKNVTEIVREILENSIEEKYFTMQKLK